MRLICRGVLILSMILLLGRFSWSDVATPEDLQAAASEAFHNGYADLAIRYSENFLTDYPKDKRNNDVRFILGQSYFMKNRFQDAYDVFFTLSQQSKPLDGVWFWLAETLAKLGNSPEAIVNYQKAIKHSSLTYVVQALYSLGWVYLEQKDYVQAQQNFMQLVTQFANNPLAEDALLKAAEAGLNRRGWADVIPLLKMYIQKYPSSLHLPDVWFNLGECYYNLEDFSSAYNSYQKTLSDVQTKPSVLLAAYNASFWSLSRLNKMNELNALAESALKQNERLSVLIGDLLLTLGNVYLDAGDAEKAFLYFDQLLASAANSEVKVGGYLGRANANFALKKYAQAKEDYRKVLDVSDQEIRQRAHIGLAWIMVKEGQVATALPLFQEVIDHTDDVPMKVNALLHMADAYQEVGQMPSAASIYRRVLNDYPQLENKDFIYYRQAMLLLKMDNIKEARLTLDSLKEEFPQSSYLSEHDYYLGVIAYKEGKWDEVGELMGRFIKGLSRPSEFTPQANYMMAIALLNMHKSDEALKIFQKIIRLYPDHPIVAPNADLGIAKCLVDTDQYKEAQKKFKIIAFKYPKTEAGYEALMWLANDDLKNNRAEEAVKYYEQVIADFAQSMPIDIAYYELAQAYDILGEEQKALDMYNRIKDESSLKSEALFATAELWNKSGDESKAIAIFEQVIKTQPEHAREAALRLGLIYRNQQRSEEELLLYQKAMDWSEGEEKVSMYQLNFLIADTLEMMGRMNEAIEKYLSIALDVEGAQPWGVKAYLRVAKIYEDNQDWQKAKLTYQKIVTLGNDESKYAQERLDWIKSNMPRMR